MARQAGPLFITGTIDDMVFYQMNGIYYMRKKGAPSSTTKKRMKHDKGYALLQLRQREFKQASQWVRSWYYQLPKAVRKHGLFGTLTGKAVRLFRKGVAEEEIKAMLLRELGQEKRAVEPPVVKAVTTTSHTVVEPVAVACKQKHKRKGKSAGRLSAWLVSEEGQLHKEVAKGQAVGMKVKDTTGLYAGYYSTWSVSG